MYVCVWIQRWKIEKCATKISELALLDAISLRNTHGWMMPLRSLNKKKMVFYPKSSLLMWFLFFCNLETSRRLTPAGRSARGFFNPRVVNFLVVSAL